MTKKVATVRAIIMNTKGDLYIQQRSKSKKYNAGLFDKTIGGHCTYGQRSDLALVTEIAQEIEAPAFVCSDHEFLNSLRNLN